MSTADHSNPASAIPAGPARHFLHDILDGDNASGRFGGRVHTRFPPEPNGYLHIGHSKSICVNYGLAQHYGGLFNLRFDDTNPAKEDQEYVDAIIDDVRWLGAAFDEGNSFGGGLFYSSDYFEQMYAFAVELIKKGKAYVCTLTADEVSKCRGTPQVPATSPHRDRPVDESLAYFDAMRAGKHPNGAMTLRARIDLTSPNFNLRDPIMYRIVHESHPHVGSKWCIYPMYDWAHGQSDSIENISFSICTLEFENHRPLYNWFCESLKIHQPRQIEFARLNITYMVMSKRKLLQLVKENHVNGWDDPRMPTISGLRRRGYTPEAMRDFCADIGIAKFNSTIEIVRLENAIRNQLNQIALRRMAVLDPIKLTITNWPKDASGNDIVEMMTAVNNPEDSSAGMRQVPFSGSLLIEQEDFREEAPNKFFRLKKGGAVRLRAAYIIDCQNVVKDADGKVIEILCTYDPQTKSGEDTSQRKVKGTIHWVSQPHAATVEVRLYDRLFTIENPDVSDGGKSFLDYINPRSLTVITASAEPSLAGAAIGDRVQFERLGYFCVDPDSEPCKPIFNRIVSLKDTWEKIESRG